MIISRNIKLLVHLFVIILNPWWWIIVQRDLWVGLLVVILSFVVFLYFFLGKSGFISLLLISLTGWLFLLSIRHAFDENIFRDSALEIQQFNKRHEFYANGLSKLYKNRLALSYFKDINFPITKLQRNSFANLDPNLYFFASHPRERLGVEEFQKISPIFLPFFLIGIFYSIVVLLPKMLIYLIPILFLSAVFSPFYNLGPILFFPIVISIITIGCLLTLGKVLNYFKGNNVA